MPATIINRYLEDCRELFLEPANFFRSQLERRTLSEALCFGLVSVWLSGVVIFFWDLLQKYLLIYAVRGVDVPIMSDIVELMSLRKDDVSFRLGALVLQPYISLISISLSALVLMGVGRMLVTHMVDASWKKTAKVVAFASVGAWCGVLPIVGGIAAYLAVMILTVMGIREQFAVSTKRATAIVLFPQIVIALFILLLLAVLGVLAFAVPWDSMLNELLSQNPRFPS